MATASTTKPIYPKNNLSGRKLFALLAQHNQGVNDDHAIAAKLDADVTTTTYESGLTAKEVAYAGYTPTEASVSGAAGAFSAGFITEEIAKAFIEQHNARVVDIRGVVTKLNADAGVTLTNYASTAKKVFALGVTPGSGEDPALYVGAGGGLDARVLQALTDQVNALTQDWHDLAAKLDGDTGVTDTDYEDELAALTLAEG
jgi:hypothetical protein